jgi:hypothetical protein
VGSLKLMHSLLDAGAVDEVRMLVCPGSRGKGTRIFEDQQDLNLVEATAFENGVALLRYEIAGSGGKSALAESAAGDAPVIRDVSGSLAGRPVGLVSSGEALELPFVHAGQPIQCCILPFAGRLTGTP